MREPIAGGVADKELEVAVRLAIAGLQHAPALVPLPCPGVGVDIGEAVFGPVVNIGVVVAVIHRQIRLLMTQDDVRSGALTQNKQTHPSPILFPTNS